MTQHLIGPLSTDESNVLYSRIQGLMRDQGWGFWAVEVPGDADFIGMIGLAKVSFNAHFTPAIEIGWRLSHEYWDKGYATEGAKACLEFGFETLNLPEIIAFTAVDNRRSRHVMEKIGMQRDLGGDFNHPKVPKGHPLERNLLYRISKQEWKNLKNL